MILKKDTFAILAVLLPVYNISFGAFFANPFWRPTISCLLNLEYRNETPILTHILSSTVFNMRVARFVICLFLSLALLGQHSANGQDIVKGLLNEYQYAIFVGTGASTSQSFHEMVLFFTPDQPNNVIHMAAAGRSAGWMATGFNGNNEAAMISSTATSTKVIRGS
jgi:hypothetical protein